MSHVRVLVGVLFALLVSLNSAVGQDDKALKAAQKQIAELERKLSEQEQFAQMREAEMQKERDIQLRKIASLEADFRRVKNFTDGDSSGFLQLLRESIETRGLHEKVKLKTAIEHFSDKFGGKLPILVNRDAFMEEPGKENHDPYEDEVSLPPVPSKMTMGTALRLIVSQLRNGQATYIIRNSHIEIVPFKYHTARYFLYEPNIVINFEKRSLADVLQALAEDSGATIHLDPNCKKAAEVISGTFRNSSLEDALIVVTEMTQLKYVILERSIFVTTRENARIIDQEEATRRKERSGYKQIVPSTSKREPAAE